LQEQGSINKNLYGFTVEEINDPLQLLGGSEITCYSFRAHQKISDGFSILRVIGKLCNLQVKQINE